MKYNIVKVKELTESKQGGTANGGHTKNLPEHDLAEENKMKWLVGLFVLSFIGRQVYKVYKKPKKG